jgi:hypothetical protein
MRGEAMQRWREAGRGRRRVVFALAALAHVALVATMWRTSLRHERAESGVVEATIWLQGAPTPRASPAPRATPARATPRAPVREAAEPGAIRRPVPQAQPIAQAASTVEPPASAASQPLDLTLSREQLRAIIAGGKPTLAQQLAAPARPSALARVGGEEAAYEEVPLAGGVTEVHVHGGCFRLVPTPRAQYDPFNHANERLMSACK